jgi:fluoroacetyl-CoA thioesterase
MKAIPIGSKGTAGLLVTPAHLANQVKDGTLPPVFATPMMLLIMENAALNAIRPFFDAGESAVGTAVNVQHLAATPATPVGHQVRAEAEVIGVEGKRITFRVRADDETAEIGNGTHERVVIDVARFSKRLAAKAKS